MGVLSFGSVRLPRTHTESLVTFSQPVLNSAFIIASETDVYFALSKIRGSRLEMKRDVKHGPASVGSSR